MANQPNQPTLPPPPGLIREINGENMPGKIRPYLHWQGYVTGGGLVDQP